MSDETKNRILKAALDLFSSRGFAAVSTKSIAADADVNEVTLFRLFSSKKNLYTEVFRRFSASPDQEAILADLHGDLVSGLERIASAIMDLLVRNDKLIRMSLRDMDRFPEINQDLEQHPRVFCQVVATYLRNMQASGIIEGDPDRLAQTFVDTLFGATLHLVTIGRDEKGLEVFRRDFTRIFAGGIGAAPGRAVAARGPSKRGS